VPDAQVEDYLSDIAEVIDDVAESMPDHAAFIAEHCDARSTAATGRT